MFNFRRTDATIPIWVAATVLALDQLTKVWAAAALDSQVIDVFWKLRLNLTTNTGFAFSAAQGFGPFLGVLALVVTVVLWRMRQRFLVPCQTPLWEWWWVERLAMSLIDVFAHLAGVEVQ